MCCSRTQFLKNVGKHDRGISVEFRKWNLYGISKIKKESILNHKKQQQKRKWNFNGISMEFQMRWKQN